MFFRKLLTINLLIIYTANLISHSVISNTAEFEIISSLDTFNCENIDVRLSILIATIELRQEKFEKLYQKLLNQIKALGLEQAVEVIYFKDNQTIKLGKKRNDLVELAKGEYVCFLDDDDDISPNYVALIFNALKSKPDCVSCTGIIKLPSGAGNKFIHSLKYKDRSFVNGVSRSQVYHINPVKRSIAKAIKFPETNWGEDNTWAYLLQKSGLLQREVEISEPYYIYLYNPHESQAVTDEVKAKRQASHKATPGHSQAPSRRS